MILSYGALHLKQYEDSKSVFETMISFTSTLASLKLKVGQMIPIYARRWIKSNHYKPFSS